MGLTVQLILSAIWSERFPIIFKIIASDAVRKQVKILFVRTSGLNYHITIKHVLCRHDAKASFNDVAIPPYQSDLVINRDKKSI